MLRIAQRCIPTHGSIVCCHLAHRQSQHSTARHFRDSHLVDGRRRVSAHRVVVSPHQHQLVSAASLHTEAVCLPPPAAVHRQLPVGDVNPSFRGFRGERVGRRGGGGETVWKHIARQFCLVGHNPHSHKVVVVLAIAAPVKTHFIVRRVLQFQAQAGIRCRPGCLGVGIGGAFVVRNVQRL